MTKTDSSAQLEDLTGRNAIRLNLLGCFLVLIIFLPILPADFLSIDDFLLVDLPVFSLPLTWRSLATIFTVGAHVDFYPVRDLSYLFDWKLLGGSTSAFHGSNLAIFLGNVLLFQELLVKLGLSRGRALLSSWLWCFLPQHVELVAWISARKDLLALFFTLSAGNVFLWAENRHRGWRGFALALFFCGVFSKPAYLFLPLLGLAWFWEQGARRAFFLVGALGAAVCAVFFRWFFSHVNPTYIQGQVSDRTGNAAAAIGRAMLGWFIAPLNILEFDGFGSENMIFPAVAAAAGAFLLVGLLYGVRTKQKRYWAFVLAIALVLGTVPNVLSAHRFYYSSRYLEPVCVVAFLGLGILAPRKWNALFLLAIFSGFWQTYGEGVSWENPSGVTRKAYLSRPESAGTATRYFVDLKNLERASRISDPEKTLLDELDRKLTKDCWPVPERRDRQIACEMYYESKLEIAKGSRRAGEMGRWSDALEVSAANFPGFGERFAVERALREGNRERAQQWKRRWLPTPRQRILQWCAACLRGERPEPEYYYSRRLLTPNQLRDFLSLDGNVAPRLRRELEACYRNARTD